MDPNAPQEFRLDPERQKVAARRRLRWLLPYTWAVTGVMVLFLWYLQRGRPGAMSGQSLAICYAVSVAFLSFSMMRATGRATRSYRLLLGADWLRIEVDQLLPIEFRRGDVRAVRETRAGLQIYRTKGPCICITRTIDGYLQIRDQVTGWAPPAAAVPSERWRTLVSVAAVFGWFGLGGLSSVATTPAPSLLLAGGSAACALWIWWVFRQLPVKRGKLFRGFMLLQAGAIVAFQILRWVALPH